MAPEEVIQSEPLVITLKPSKMPFSQKPVSVKPKELVVMEVIELVVVVIEERDIIWMKISKN